MLQSHEQKFDIFTRIFTGLFYKREKMSLYDYLHKYKDEIDTYVHRYNIMKGNEPLPDFSQKLQ